MKTIHRLVREFKKNMMIGKDALAELRQEYRDDEEYGFLVASFILGPAANFAASCYHTIKDEMDLEFYEFMETKHDCSICDLKEIEGKVASVTTTIELTLHNRWALFVAALSLAKTAKLTFDHPTVIVEQ